MSDDLPIVGRPRGSAWRQLQSEGILWEGQILVAGGDTDLAALLIVTNERLSLVRGGAVALDIKHDWLPTPPTLRRTGTVGLQVLTPGQRFPESLTLIIREGRLAAAELVDVLTPQERYEPEFSSWNSSMFLDEDPIIPARPAPYERKHSPAPVDPLPPFPVYAALDDDDFPPIAPPPDPMPDWSGAPMLAAGAGADPNANVIPRQNDWNLKPITGMDNKGRRDRRAWAMRVAAIFLAVAGIATWQSGLLPDYASVRDRFADNTPEIHSVAQVPSGTPARPTAPPTVASTQSASTSTGAAAPTSSSADLGPTSTEQKPTYAPAEQTALALGVGGGETDPSDAATTPESAEPAATNAPVIEPPPATEAPATEPSATAAAPTELAESESPAAPATEPAVSPTQTTQSVMPKPTEAPAVTDGALDFSIADLQTGSSLPELTLGPLRGEQWVVVTLDIRNTGNTAATLDTNGFQLTTAEGETFAPDSATGAVAKFLGLSGNGGSGATREIGPGERVSIVLVFVPPADATGFALEADGTSIPLETGASGTSASVVGGTTAASTGQTANRLSAQLLIGTLEQFDILSPTATATPKIAPRIGNP